MFFNLKIEAFNEGAKFFVAFDEKKVSIRSTFPPAKEDGQRTFPLASLTSEDGRQVSIQIVDIKFFEDFIYIDALAINSETNTGGKVIFRLLL